MKQRVLIKNAVEKYGQEAHILPEIKNQYAVSEWHVILA